MRATDFEFRNRFWVIFALFGAGFACYFVDHRNAAQALTRLLHLDDRMGLHVLFGLGAVLAFAAAALRTWASAYLRSAVVKDAALHADRLVADGPYRHLRNPLYLGTYLLTIAFALMASPLGFLVMVGGMLVVLLRLIGREEAELERGQGGSYDAYRRAVPALWPAFVPRVAASGARPEWRQAVAGELMMWAFALGAAAFAATFNQWILYGFVALGMIGYLPGKRAT